MAELNLNRVSLNTASLDDFTECRKIFNCLKTRVSHKVIVFVQESQSARKDENLWTNQFGHGDGLMIFSHGKSYAR